MKAYIVITNNDEATLSLNKEGVCICEDVSVFLDQKYFQSGRKMVVLQDIIDKGVKGMARKILLLNRKEV